MKAYLGIDVGSISTKLALLSPDSELIDSVYLHTEGRPKEAVKKALAILHERLPADIQIEGTGVTGSARKLIGEMLGADLIKNEIICQGIASIHLLKDVQTVIEIGGQDSKLIIIRDGIVTDFAMNTICSAGTGAFLDYQAKRLGIKMDDFGNIALQSKTRVDIAGRCTVFSESDMIHKAQAGAKTEDILAGLCRTIAKNFLSNLARSKQLLSPIMFQGGVAANTGVKKAFEEELECPLIVPPHHKLTGALGCALLIKERLQQSVGEKTCNPTPQLL